MNDEYCTKKVIFPIFVSKFFIAELSVKALVRAEKDSRQVHPYVGGEDFNRELTPFDMRSMQPASITDIGKSMKEQLIILVEWAKKMPWFCNNLDMDDQVRTLD